MDNSTLFRGVAQATSVTHVFLLFLHRLHRPGAYEKTAALGGRHSW